MANEEIKSTQAPLPPLPDPRLPFPEYAIKKVISLTIKTWWLEGPPESKDFGEWHAELADYIYSSLLDSGVVPVDV